MMKVLNKVELTSCCLMLVLAFSPRATARTLEYATFFIDETIIPNEVIGERTLTVRFETDRGASFECVEKEPNSKNSFGIDLRKKCLDKMRDHFGVMRPNNFHPKDVSGFEPIFLSFLGRRGWEVFDVNEEQHNGRYLKKNMMTFRLKK
ncbi:hypothetical protein IC617_08160 [Neiella sp. HB171785]|uniref:Secreted protein n=1 Tax=Neiella litorisoli TaxID=2771431 RepID=A0A8J6QIN9_9GAMM|nr:hypothetical protein [Neiella litorisoli]MBD1389397.1 hypothetical protein [Neiella litorisoli]